MIFCCSAPGSLNLLWEIFLHDKRYIAVAVGQLSWMFIDSCKRLKIMKGSDAIGLGAFFNFNPYIDYSTEWLFSVQNCMITSSLCYCVHACMHE
ncbi:hypothetical protein WN944_021465 [Citrus x changshan-huyou]|uniref:Auxin-responsive protein n=1 Tax=Citrus x changshan-huyou TaxID=2935761 RepID=A0AAP0N371_9ROSI